jgi:hypothetical protein
MAPLLAGLIVLAMLVLLGRGYIRASPRNLVKGARFSGGVLLALITIALALTGRIGFAFLAAGGAWALLFGTMPPWLRPAQTAGGGPGQSRSDAPQTPRTSSMSRAEALKVLGLQESASEEEIRAAHRRLIVQNHPDKGGTSYLASKINEAKDVLLRR